MVFRFEFIDGLNLDQLKYYIEFNMSAVSFTNLTNNTVFFNNTSPTSKSKASINRIKYFTLVKFKENIQAILSITFYNRSSGGYFNVNSRDVNNLMMVIEVKSDDSDYPLHVQVGNVQVEESEVAKPSAMIGASIAQAAFSMGSVYLMWKYQQMHFMNTASYASIMILSILYFQLFGIYIILAL